MAMKKLMTLAWIAICAMIVTPAHAQYDDDIYYSKKAAKASAYKGVETWETSANDDWDLDNYNRRSSGSSALSDESSHTSTSIGNDAVTYTSEPQVIHDTIYVVEQYYFSDRIRRFHNPVFGFHLYSPWYDVAFYDPFFWDYCYYDPWWYVNPSFGFGYGHWYPHWNFGYYAGWYGGWYAPYFHPQPHYFHPSYAHHCRPIPNRGSRLNNMGGRYNNNLPARSSGGSRSAVASNTDRSNHTSPSRVQSGGGSRSNSSTQIASSAGNRRATSSTVTNRVQNNSNFQTQNAQSTASRVQGTATTTNRNGSSSVDNSRARRQDNGVRQSSTGKTYSRPATSSESNTSNRVSTASRSNNNRSETQYNRSSSSRSSNSSNYSPSSSSSSRSSYSSGSRSGGSSSGGGSRSGGGRR